VSCWIPEFPQGDEQIIYPSRTGEKTGLHLCVRKEKALLSVMACIAFFVELAL
jgi:hypothetical protein